MPGDKLLDGNEFPCPLVTFHFIDIWLLVYVDLGEALCFKLSVLRQSAMVSPYCDNLFNKMVLTDRTI